MTSPHFGQWTVAPVISAAMAALTVVRLRMTAQAAVRMVRMGILDYCEDATFVAGTSRDLAPFDSGWNGLVGGARISRFVGVRLTSIGR